MYLDAFIDSLNLNRETINGYKYDVKSFLTFIKNRNNNDNLSLVELVDIYAYVDYLKNKNSSRTIARKISAINKYFSFLERNNYIEKNIFYNFKFSYNPTSNLSRLTDRQISDLIEYSSSLKITHKLIIYLMLFNGLTANELRNIKIKDIYDNIIVINKDKENEKIVKINDALKSILSDFLRFNKRQYLLNGRNGNQISKRTIQDIVKKVLMAIGINEKGVSGGILKNTSIYMLKKYNGVGLEEIQKFLGYKTIAPAKKYMDDKFDNIDMNKNPYGKLYK